jgi:hypothetical protein
MTSKSLKVRVLKGWLQRDRTSVMMAVAHFPRYQIWVITLAAAVSPVSPDFHPDLQEVHTALPHPLRLRVYHRVYPSRRHPPLKYFSPLSPVPRLTPSPSLSLKGNQSSVVYFRQRSSRSAYMLSDHWHPWRCRQVVQQKRSGRKPKKR